MSKPLSRVIIPRPADLPLLVTYLSAPLCCLQIEDSHFSRTWVRYTLVQAINIRWAVNKSRDSSVGIVSGYGLDDRGSNPCSGKRFFLFYIVQIGSEAHPVCYPIGTGTISLVVKGLGREADHFSLSCIEITNDGTTPPITHMSSWQSV
jgi:hypothetical protein